MDNLEPARLESVALDRQCFDQLAGFVRRASRWVLLTLYQFDPRASPALVSALNDAAASGVDVRVVVNRWGLQRAARRCTAQLADALVPEVQLRLWRHLLTNNTHSKYALRDDGAMLVLTSNVSEQFTRCRWRGLGVVVGDAPEAAQEVWAAFRYLWKRSRPTDCRGRGRREPRPTPTRGNGRAVDVGVAVRWQGSCATCRRRPDAAPHQAIHRLIDQAVDTVDIVTPNLSSRDVVAALKRAADRGVRVRAVLARRMNDFYRHIGHLTNEQTARRLPAEVRWTGGGECRSGGCMAATETAGINHSKLMVVDGRRVLVGSTNLDFLSMKHASELNLELDDPSGTMARVFDEFWDGAEK